MQSRYAYPAGAYFCMRASSRALLHIGLLSLWDRQPSNAPPLLLSPAGLASRRGPIPKRTWGCAPRPPNAKLRLDTNDAKASSVRRRRYALKVPAAHFYVKFLQTDSRKSCCRAYGLNKQLFAQTAPPPQRGRRSTRSARKNRASEQREDFFEHRKAVGADAPAATFGAHLCAVRIWIFLLRKIQIRS